MGKNRRGIVAATAFVSMLALVLSVQMGSASAGESSTQDISDTLANTTSVSGGLATQSDPSSLAIQSDPASLAAQATSYDIGNGSVTCDQGGTLYTITGTSNSHTITVRGGTAENPVRVDLAGVTMKFQGEEDGDSTEASPLTVEDGAYAIIYIGGNDASVVDTLTGGNEHGVGKNTGYAGICVKSDAHVTIAGQGTLNVTGGGVEYGAAAIGGNYDEDVHDLTIAGNVTINAIGGYSAPGIGSGRDGELYSLVINGGTINATGGKYAPGIGAGDAVGTGGGGTTHSITIYGGTITATGGYKAAGIGGSEGGSTKDITIYGDTITATGGEEGAGIGGGSGGDVSSITVYGGTVTATGGANGAGIGGGKGAASGEITIAEGSPATLGITAIGGTNGAGIGSAGHDSDKIDISLDDGTITATGGDSGAGIGAGNADAGEISIEGTGTIWAKGGKQGCGIGAGEDSTADGITIEGTSRQLTINAEALTVVPTDETSLKLGPVFYANKNAAIGSGRSECGPITINNAVVNAAANGYGADIGGGYNHGWNPASVKSIYISNCAVASVDFKGNVPNDKVAPSIGSGTDGNVGSIEIYNSTVTGAGIGAASEKFDDCNAVDKIIIQGCTVSAIRQVVDWDASNSASQAAGIGSGIGGDIGSIDIEDSTVTAQGVGGGAGIGSGGVSGASYSEGKQSSSSDVGTIIIRRSNITATGSVQGVTDDLKSGGPGIGLGFAVGGNGTIHSILIDQCSNVTATGEWGAAGIGTSCGSSFTGGDDGDGNVTIMYSNVTAEGGYGAAGIGAGMQYKLHGGDARIIQITGASAITATGGEGAAGIGGGKDGGVDSVTIALESTGLPPASQEYVTATGGLGAADIGSGAGGHDVGSVTIQSGCVTATGGADLDGKGTGAGIGGGNAQGVLKNLSISGGYINANAGSSDAYDIGCGGTGSALSTDQNGTFTISGGTVLATNVGYAKTMIVTGGSVLANLTNAYDAAHNPVYRTTLTLPIGAKTEADVSSFVDGYGATDIYSDGNRKVYLYRTATDEFKASADVTTSYQATPYRYIGQTLADGSGMLKMQPQFSFKNPEATPVVGGTFQIDVDDSQLPSPGSWGDCKYTVSGCASETNNPPSNARHTGAYVSLEANSIGTYTVTATCAPSSAPNNNIADTYWPVTATYTGTVTQQAGAISITEDPSKIYDGQAVADPSVTTTGDSAVTYTYYTGTDVSAAGAKLNAAPVDQGTYTVVASMAGTDHYTAASASESFTITPRPITLGLSASLSDDKGTATLSATVLNAVDAQGDVDFTITKPDGTTTVVRGEIAASGDTYVAQASFPDVGAGTYTVEASYSPAMSGDYSCAATASASFNKEYVTRSINVASSVTAAYGDKTFNLDAAASTSEGANDQFAYEVSSDEFAAYGLNPTILVDAAGNVTPTNAGVATVKITLTDSSNHYAPAIAYVKVTVTRAKLTVTPYVKDSGGDMTTVATYGGLGGLTYGLTFDGFKGEDNADTFTGGHGHLEAVPLAPTAGTGTYNIGIKRVGDGSVKINGNDYYNVFVSRNYEITEVESELIVGPATLKVTANDATGTWGGAEPTYGVSLSGFVLSDTASSVFSTQPKATLDTRQTGGKSFSELEPGAYSGAVSATAGTLNTDASGKNYTVETVPGTLTVAKADPALAISVDSKTYDGKAVNEPTVTTSTDPKFDGTYTVTYYPLDSEKALSGAPTDAGQYRATATVKDAAHFADASAGCLFTIDKATPDVKTPTLPTLAYEEGLTLAKDQPLSDGWTWDNPDTVLSAGTVKANATYTPADTTNYTTVTRTLTFEVTEAEGSITITDPSKTYDGTAVADPTVTTENNAKVTYAWYARTEPVATLLTSAPVDAGDYVVAATVADDGNHTSATGYKEFTIAKATPDVETPTLETLVYRDGLTLSDQALPSGWAWNEPARALSVGAVTADATYTPADTKNYDTVTRGLSFEVLAAQGTVSITEDISKIYDGTPVDDPTVSMTGDGTVSFAYYAGTDTTNPPLASAPTDAGTYTVVATLAETEKYKGATDAKSFEIRAVPLVLGISATQSGTSSTVTVTALGMVSADGSAKISVLDASGATVTKEVLFAQTVSGVFEATATFDSVASGTYTVTAAYAAGASGNYTCEKDATTTFDMSRATRTIDVASSFDKTYGDESFALGAKASVGTAGDAFAYEVVQDSSAAYGLDPCITVDADGNVTVENAGSCSIKITLSDTSEQGTYNDANAYVKVTVSPAALTVTSYAARDGAPVESTAYGSLGTLTYGLDFSGLVNGDKEDGFTNGHGTLVSAGIDERSDVASDPYMLPIEQVGSSAASPSGMAIASSDGSLFVSRNYQITYEHGTLAVTPAVLTVRAADATGVWKGTEPTYPCAVDGFATWDGEDTAFSVKPTATLDTTKTGGKAYDELEPGTYDEALKVASTGTLKPNGNGLYNYTVTAASGETAVASLTVEKAQGTITIDSDPSKTYDGTPVADPSVTKSGTGTVTYTYYTGTDTMTTPLASAPTEVGTYIVVATMAEDDHYTSAAASRTFTIAAAPGGGSAAPSDNAGHATTTPKTGDTTSLLMLPVLALLATAGILMCILARRRAYRKNVHFRK